MKILRMGNGLTLLLLSISLICGAGVAYQLQRLINPQQASRSTVIPAPEPLGIELPQDVSAPLERSVLKEILGRPLFSVGRTPPAAPVEVAAIQPAAKPVELQLQLEGIVITPNKRIALVRDLKSNEFLRLPEGVRHRGWLVDGVRPGRALLKRGDQDRELVFELERAPGNKLKKNQFQKRLAGKAGNAARSGKSPWGRN